MMSAVPVIRISRPHGNTAVLLWTGGENIRFFAAAGWLMFRLSLIHIYPRYEKSKANKALGKFLSLHPHNLAQKTQIIVEHFRTCLLYTSIKIIKRQR